MLLAHFICDARFREPHEFGERRVRPTRAARQSRNEASHRGVAVPIQPAQINRINPAAGGTTQPQEPKSRGNSRTTAADPGS